MPCKAVRRKQQGQALIPEITPEVWQGTESAVTPACVTAELQLQQMYHRICCHSRMCDSRTTVRANVPHVYCDEHRSRDGWSVLCWERETSGAPKRNPVRRCWENDWQWEGVQSTYLHSASAVPSGWGVSVSHSNTWLWFIRWRNSQPWSFRSYQLLPAVHQQKYRLSVVSKWVQAETTRPILWEITMTLSYDWKEKTQSFHESSSSMWIWVGGLQMSARLVCSTICQVSL